MELAWPESRLLTTDGFLDRARPNPLARLYLYVFAGLSSKSPGVLMLMTTSYAISVELALEDDDLAEITPGPLTSSNIGGVRR